MSTMLMKVQVGPVQEFIAQARSTRDMWAGSYLLSWLTASAMKVFKEAGCEFVFPVLDKQPLYEMFNGDPSDAGLIPTLPNVFMLRVKEEGIEELAEKAKAALKKELSVIGDACWGKMLELEASKDCKTRWDTQLDAFPIINWQAVEETGNWQDDVERLGKEMAARRNTRDFDQWGVSFDADGDVHFDSSLEGASKDVLSGKEEIIGTPDFWKKNQEFWKGAGPLGAMNCIKRLFPFEVLEKRFSSRKTFWENMRVEDTRDLSEKNRPDKGFNPYIAVIAMDGDRMGAALKNIDKRDVHSRFSATLATFSQDEVKPLVDQVGGQLIYAGGDDLLAMCPADRALELSSALRSKFLEVMTEFINLDPEKPMDASCGIAVGHYKFPLQRIVEEARQAEHRAKNKRGRAAFELALLKHSGEIIHWGAKWKSPALELYRLYTKMAAPEDASSRVPYALAELLAPYRLSSESDAVISIEQLREIVKKEYAHVRSRQKLVGTEEEQKKMDELASSYLTTVFSEKGEESGGIPTDFSNLFLASAFMNRQRGEN